MEKHGLSTSSTPNHLQQKSWELQEFKGIYEETMMVNNPFNRLFLWGERPELQQKLFLTPTGPAGRFLGKQMHWRPSFLCGKKGGVILLAEKNHL